MTKLDDPVAAENGAEEEAYVLDAQIGYLLRLANQRHALIFQELSVLDLTPTQFSAMVRLLDEGECSQNELGRRTAMDVATIKGVVDRLRGKGLVTLNPDPNDKRRTTISAASPPARSKSRSQASSSPLVSAVPATRMRRITLSPLSARSCLTKNGTVVSYWDASSGSTSRNRRGGAAQGRCGPHARPDGGHGQHDDAAGPVALGQ